MLIRTVGGVSTALFVLLIGLAELELPSAGWWDEVTDPLKIGAVAAGALVFAYGIFEVVDGPRRARRDRAEAEFRESQAGVEALCRRAFVPINRQFPEVAISKVGVHVWRVKSDDSELERVYKYTMEHQRPETGLRWTKGRGAIGMAWSTRQVQVVTTFGAVVDQAQASPDDEAFKDALSEDERFGLDRAEVLEARNYEAILAFPLTGKPAPGSATTPIVGVFSVDFKVDVDAQRLTALLHEPDFVDILGSCENYLRTLSEAKSHD